MNVHNFDDSLKRSNASADEPWWNAVYQQAFPDLAGSVSVRDDGWAQRGGIDRVLTLASGKTLTVDEKVREADWPDFLLEVWSDRERRVKGWVAKDLACDYIAYAFKPTATCYLLPFQQLRRAWRTHHNAWWNTYRRVEAKNHDRGRNWTTESVCVPKEVVLNAIRDALTVTWKAEAA